jgi:3',5'-cyclic AMP phosphodiesterase CpdA
VGLFLGFGAGVRRMSGRFILAQISDTHVRADDSGASVAQLVRAMAQAREYRADVILLTGDLVNDEREDEYAALAEAIVDPPAPLYLMPGNHDDRALIRRTFPTHAYLPHAGNLSFVIDNHPVRVVAVDQIVPNETYGILTPEHASWLDRALAEAPGKPTVVALHHQPFLTHDLLFDRIGLVDADLFTNVIARHRQVARIICGHHHRLAVGQVAHAPVIVAPSTSWTYGLAMHAGQPIAPKTAEQPGWMLHVWTEAAGFASHFMGL